MQRGAFGPLTPVAQLQGVAFNMWYLAYFDDVFITWRGGQCRDTPAADAEDSARRPAYGEAATIGVELLRDGHYHATRLRACQCLRRRRVG